MQKYQFDSNQTMKDAFLNNRPIPSKFRLATGEIPYGYIYCIENKTNGKKYFGSTYSVYVGVAHPRPMHSLSKRASHYIYEYNKAMQNMTNGAKKTYRPIIQAMVNEGINNFVMYPVAETTKKTHISLENYFIRINDTINLGYNINHAGTSAKRKGRVLSIQDKLIRSEKILAINMNKQELVVADSMKLFADFIGTTKDIIKNNARKGLTYRGWFIFYINKEKREYVLINNVINDQDKRRADRHSEKAKEFYKSLYNSVSSYLEPFPSTNNEYFPNFKRLDDLLYTR